MKKGHFGDKKFRKKGEGPFTLIRFFRLRSKSKKTKGGPFDYKKFEKRLTGLEKNGKGTL